MYYESTTSGPNKRFAERSVDLTIGAKVAAPQERSTAYGSHWLEVRHYITGETKAVRCSNYVPEHLPPPREKGKKVEAKLTSKARSKIKLAGRVVGAIQNKRGKRRSTIFTLTYPKAFPDCQTSKCHLQTMMKRLRRQYPDMLYVWCQELQKRGAPHFHILTDTYIDKNILNNSWNDIVSNWQKGEGIPQQKAYPEIEGTKNPGGYMAKYMSKGDDTMTGNLYGISHNLRQKMKPIAVYRPHLEEPEKFDKKARQFEEMAEKRNWNAVTWQDKDHVDEATGEVTNPIRGIWIAPGPSFSDVMIEILRIFQGVEVIIEEDEDVNST